ncbi:MAG TPA: tetratricopeptide repeat protein [Vicinamibacterales bacterium]|nr:tetratricopeptide repeat protein [Vicinamibacterales bacterium]
MADGQAPSRIDDLRRRVESDPASIAFAQLAEEYRRAGDYAEAIRVCRAGLERHPTYVSARVTLGRALAASGELDDAEAELNAALRVAPDNLAAIRALAEIHQQRGEALAALDQPPATAPAVGPSPADIAARPKPDQPPPQPEVDQRPPSDPVLDALEAWLEAIIERRAQLAARAERRPPDRTDASS